MATELILHPAFLVLLGGLVLPLVPPRARGKAFLLFPLAALWVCWNLSTDQNLTVEFLQYRLSILQVDRLSRVFGIIFSLIAVAGGLFALHLRDTRQQVAALLYAGSALGLVFSGDWLSLFFFWELTAVSSTVLIWSRQGTGSSVGLRYLLVHLFGGSLLLAGILGQVHGSGEIAVQLLETGRLSSWLILGGIAVNAAIPPLHAWLSDAYPKATVTGAVFLSAFTTKSAVYLLVRVAPGWEVLITLGVIMALYGVIFAVLANDIREILAYHIISQVGYMVAGVGIGTPLALDGTVAHAFSHILYKALLFMGAGAVLQATGRSRLTELGGLGRKMPVTLWLYMVGAFSISGFPLFNGFISKSMVVSAALEARHQTAFFLLVLASVGTFLHTGLKLPYFTWFGSSRGEGRVSRPPLNMHLAMGLVALLCVGFGVLPSLLYAELPYGANYRPYTIPHLVESIQLLSATFFGFWWYRSKLAGESTLTLDADWFYRRPAGWVRRCFVEWTSQLFDRADAGILVGIRWLALSSHNPALWLGRWLERNMGPAISGYDPGATRPKLEFVVGLILLSALLFAATALLR